MIAEHVVSTPLMLRVPDLFQELLTFPIKVLINVVLPAPEGPMIAVIFPAFIDPETPANSVLFFLGKTNRKSSKKMSSGGELPRDLANPSTRTATAGFICTTVSNASVCP